LIGVFHLRAIVFASTDTVTVAIVHCIPWTPVAGITEVIPIEISLVLIGCQWAIIVDSAQTILVRIIIGISGTDVTDIALPIFIAIHLVGIPDIWAIIDNIVGIVPITICVAHISNAIFVGI